MITSIRPIIVDYLKSVDAIKSIVGDNVTDIDYNFEDLYGAQANALSFPAISVEEVGLDPEYSTNRLDMNQYSEPLNLTLYQQVRLHSSQVKYPRSLSCDNPVILSYP